MSEINRNIKTYGSSTNTQETVSYPDLQIMFNIQVQNNTYITFKIKKVEELGVLHEYGPKQYTFLRPKFCIPITKIVIIEITKYT